MRIRYGVLTVKHGSFGAAPVEIDYGRLKDSKLDFKRRKNLRIAIALSKKGG